MARFLQAMLIAVPALLEALLFLSRKQSGGYGHRHDDYDDDYFGG